MNIEITCSNLIKEYGLNEETIKSQLALIQIEELKEQDTSLKEGGFAIPLKENPTYSLIFHLEGEIIALTNIIKAIDYEKMDNSDLLN